MDVLVRGRAEPFQEKLIEEFIEVFVRWCKVRAKSPLLAALIALVSLHAAPPAANGQVTDTVAAAAALAEFEEACARVEDPWPVPLCGRVVLVDPATRLAVANRPDPARRFSRLNDAWVGVWPEGMIVANTDVEWGGERWAMAMLPLSDDRFTRFRLLAHESFHRIQRDLGHDPADPMANHLDEDDGRLWLRLELRALARALETEGGEARAAALDGLLFRAVRHARYPGARDAERQLELHEGLAEYTGVRFALDATGRPLPEAAPLTARFENRPTYVRSLGYGTGPALGLLLDRYRPGWREGLEPASDLAALLADALEAREPGPDLLIRARSRAVRYGFAEVRAEEARRAERMATERARFRKELVEGPVLILELPERRLLFNPNTVVSLGEEGSVYPGAVLEGPWGRLTLTDGAALATPERDSAWVRAPQTWEADADGRVEGPGWVLELTPGWRPAAAARAGDFRLELEPDAGEPHPCAASTQLCEGDIRVPLDRADPTAGDLSIAFIWVPRADTTRPADGTILAIPGGPQEALPQLERYRRALGPVLDRQNMLMIDPRGLGRSDPLLCPDLALDKPETVAACATALGRVDLFTAEQAVADMDAVREALGVPSVTVYGNSYGTVLAQAYAARFSDRTDAIYLDSVVMIGEDGYVDYVEGDIRRVRTDLVELVCDRSPTCRAIPETPTALLERLVEDVRRDPDPVALRHLAALVGTFIVNRVATRGLVAAMAAWLAGDPLPLYRMTGDFRGPDSFPPPAGAEWAGFLAYQCGDGRYAFDRAASATERRRQLAEYYQSGETLHPFTLNEMGGETGHDFWCLNWPTPRDTPPVPPDASYPAVPVLALAGDFDSHSPAEVASVMRRMPEAKLIQVRYGTHGLALHPAPVGRCARDIMRAFLSDPRHPPAPAVRDADCDAETFLALGSFPRTVATVPPARTDDLPAGDRALVAAAFTTAADALVRRDPNHAFPVPPVVPGIRGGQVRYERGSRDVILEGTRFVEDLAIDGTLRFGDDDIVTADLVATGPDGHPRALTLRWRAFVPDGTTQVKGAIDGLAFDAAVPLP